MKTIKKNLIFIITLIIGTLITIPFLKPTFTLDSYCLIASGYKEYAIIFLQAGRILSALSYYIFSLINLDYKVLSVLSIIFSNIFLALSVKTLYQTINKSNKLNLLVLIGAFLSIYTITLIELFLFKESFIMCLGAYFVTLSIKEYQKQKKFTLLQIIYVLLAQLSYQGVMCLYIPLLFLILSLNNNSFKNIIKELFKGVLIYGISFILSYLLVKLVAVFIPNSEKLGSINIIENIKLVLVSLKERPRYLYNLGSPKIFYLILFSTLIITSVKIIVNKNKKQFILIILLILNLICCIIFPYIPNLMLETTTNSTAARMAISLTSLIGITILYNTIIENKKLDTLLILIGLVFMSYIGYDYIKLGRLNNQRYTQDMNDLNYIYEKINDYEKNNQEIKEIHYAYDDEVDWYYSNMGNKSYGVRMIAATWGLTCAIDGFQNKKYNYIEMTEQEKEEYFKNKNFDKFEEEQFIFIEDKLYILLY